MNAKRIDYYNSYIPSVSSIKQTTGAIKVKSELNQTQENFFVR